MHHSISSIFAGSFNMNGVQISSLDASKWLQKERSKKLPSAIESDLVILSLQECPSAPSTDHDTTRIDGIPIIRVLASLSTSSSIRVEDKVQTTIQKALASQHTLIADIAMGEPTSSTSDSEEDLKWYGFVRLLIFVKYNVLESIDHLFTNKNLIPILAPAGRKADGCTGYEYPLNRSPDKGGICLYISSMNLLICSFHLCGTNAYEIPESDFDSIRINELNIIGEECYKVIGNNPYDSIICGDLNFRVEVHNSPEDKTRGGNDFQAVHAVLKEDDPTTVQHLFRNQDRLFRLLQYLEGDRSVDAVDERTFSKLDEKAQILMEVRDTIEMHIDNNGKNDDALFHPTFTFETKAAIDSRRGLPASISRSYSKKRTPAWTDRILVSKRLLQKGWSLDACCADHSVLSSDHVPVFAGLSFKPK